MIIKPVPWIPTTSAQLAAALTDETGTGVVVFNVSPTLVSPSATKLYVGDGIGTFLSYVSSEKTAINVANASFTENLADWRSKHTATVNGTYNSVGLYAHAVPIVAAGVTNSGHHYGIIFEALRNLGSEMSEDAGTLTWLHGITASAGHYDTNAVSPITTSLQVLESTIHHRTGTITNAKGLALVVPTGSGTITNLWGIHQGEATAGNYFAGRIGIGVGNTSPSTQILALLHLKAGTTVANTAPIQLTSGPPESTPRAGLIEYYGANFLATGPNLLNKPLNNQHVLASKLGANMNITTDQAIVMPAGRWVVRKIVVDNASISLTTAAGGIYTAASKGGTAIVAAAQVYSALTASDKFLDLTLAAAMATDILTATTIYFSLTTAQGAAATADIFIIGDRLDY